jgi:hypothetical protein
MSLVMSAKYYYPYDLDPNGPTTTTTGLDSFKLKGWNLLLIKLKPTREQTRHLVSFAAMLVVIVVFYQFRVTRLFLYPFELVSTVFHEFGHALMCILTGGRVAAIEVNPNESGVTRFVGGFTCLILPAGYLGSSLAGATLLILSFGEKSARAAAIGTGVVLLSTVFWSGTLFTALSALFMIAALAAASLTFPHLLQLLVLFMGTMGSVVSLLSIFSHLISNQIEGSDAVEFARSCSVLLPSTVYGVIWFAFSAVLIVASLATGIYAYK